MKPCAVYYLTDPETLVVRYVGISVDPKRRYKTHLDSKKHPQRHSACWIRGLSLCGLAPLLRIVVWAQTNEEAKRLEIALIAKFSNLTNISSGGEGGTDVRWSEERKTAHGARVRERYKDPEARARQSEAARRCWDNPEARARASAASTGRVQSAEVRARKSAVLMRHSVSAEARLKMSDSQKGKRHTAETRAKMTAAQVGRYSKRSLLQEEDRRAKISATKQSQYTEVLGGQHG